MEGLLGLVLNMYKGLFNITRASAESVPDKSEQGHIYAHQHSGRINDNTERDREPDNGGDCDLPEQTVGLRLQKVYCTGAFQVLIPDAT